MDAMAMPAAFSKKNKGKFAGSFLGHAVRSDCSKPRFTPWPWRLIRILSESLRSLQHGSRIQIYIYMVRCQNQTIPILKRGRAAWISAALSL